MRVKNKTKVKNKFPNHEMDSLEYYTTINQDLKKKINTISCSHDLTTPAPYVTASVKTL